MGLVHGDRGAVGRRGTDVARVLGLLGPRPWMELVDASVRGYPDGDAQDESSEKTKESAVAGFALDLDGCE